MITAVDSQGQIYVSLLQANTDTDIMMLFMKEFIITLDQEDKNWRRNSIIFWDGAGYHKSKEVVKMMED
jgi:hypothetical protein